jgi:hypothetical protein
MLKRNATSFSEAQLDPSALQMIAKRSRTFRIRLRLLGFGTIRARTGHPSRKAQEQSYIDRSAQEDQPERAWLVRERHGPPASQLQTQNQRERQAVICAALAAYLAIAISFILLAMRKRPSATDVVLLLLWPIPLAILAAWLLIFRNEPMDA